MGKLMLDIGKLVFGGMFIAGILRGELPQATIIFSGLALAFVTFALGLLFTTKEDKTVENKE
jgi:tRNA A-37 threonylcarbamoyl transferase component Bud32